MTGIEIERHCKPSGSLEAASAAIAALAGEIWREHYTPIIGAEQVEYMLAKFQSPGQIRADIETGGYVYFTAKRAENGERIGYSACQPREGYLWLSKIYVRKDHRGRGVSRGLLGEASALCRREYGLGRIRLSVNRNNGGAIAAYRKMGFEMTGSVKTDIGGGFYMDDDVMELRL